MKNMKPFVLMIFVAFFILPSLVLAQEEQEVPQYPPQAIINAAYMGDVEMVRFLLSIPHDKDYRDALGGTALHVAIFSNSRNNLEVIRLLLDNGFDINAISKYNGYTPLHYCVWINNLDAARLLVSYHADRNIRDNNGLTPQEKASREGKRDMLLILARN
ncbi:MAG: ankyrin repeat domain-containing protein [Treponema sp.]|jgi:ankyrin repeat protein|nr:ankyrin repeat domain-containing protein [Treponema sp.]